MWRSRNWVEVEVVRWETLAALKQYSLCWSRGRCSTWSFFFFSFCFFAFNLWVSIQSALLLYTAHLISKLSLNCWCSHKIVSAELRASAPYLKGLSLNWIVRNSRKLLKTIQVARERWAFHIGQKSPWPPPPYFWNHFADFLAQVNICPLWHLFMVKYNLNMKANLWLIWFRFQIFLHFSFEWCILRIFIDLHTFVAKF